MNTIEEIFSEAQNVKQPNKGNINKLKLAYAKSNNESFTVITKCYDKVLQYSKKEQSVERLLIFFTHFVAELSSNDYEKCMGYLIDRSYNVDKTVRYRSCQSIHLLLEILSEKNGEIFDSLWISLSKFIFPRLRDKCPIVRQWAAKIAIHLQDPTEQSDRITMELVRLFESDSSVDVRIAALTSCAISKHSIDHIIARIRDVRQEVRKTTISLISQFIDSRQLNSKQKSFILKYGLSDRDETVSRLVYDDIVLKWLHVLDYDVPRLLKGLTIYCTSDNGADNSNQKICDAEVLAYYIVANAEKSGQSGNRELLRISREECPLWESGLSSISARELVWVVARCEYYASNKKSKDNKFAADNILDDLLPDAVVLSELLSQAHVALTNYASEEEGISAKSSELETVLGYLLRMSTFVDVTEPTGSQCIADSCKRMLMDVRLPDYLVELVLVVYSKTCFALQQNVFHEAKQISLMLWAKTIRNDDEEESERVYVVDSELYQVRVMEITAWCVQTMILKQITHNEDMKFDEFIPYAIGSLQQPSSLLRSVAVRCLGLFAIYSETNCVMFRDIIFQVADASEEEEDIRCQAIESLGDMALVYSDTSVMNGNKLSTSIKRMLESGCDALVRSSAEVSIKLLFSGRLSDPAIFAHLLGIYFQFEPSSDSNIYNNENVDVTKGSANRLNQLLSIFFPTFVSAANGREEVVLESITTLISDTVNYIQFNPAWSMTSKMIEQLLYWCDNVQSISQQKEIASNSFCNKVKSRLCAALFKEMLLLGISKTDKCILKELCKVFAYLTPCDWAEENMVGSIFNVAEIVKSRCQLDKASISIIQKFIGSCSSNSTESNTAEFGRDKFLNYAIGLADLIETGHSSEEDEDENEEKFTKRQTIARKNPVKAPVVFTENISRPERASKTKAQHRMSLQNEDMDIENNLNHKSNSYVESDI